jgi:hypothetical protein
MQVGTAYKDITPNPGIELSGFAIRPQPSDRVLDPLYCKVMGLKSGGVQIFWIQLDLIGLEMTFVAKVRARLADKFYLPPTHFIIATTHTHSGPGTVPLNYCGQYQPDYLSKLETTLEKCCADAVDNMETCQASFGYCPYDLAVDRRDQKTENIDPYLRHIVFTKQDKTAKALLWNYAMHPVCLRGSGISADYPGAVCEALSRKLPGHPMTVFALGACGNINPPEVGMSYENMTQMAENMANRLAKDVLNSLNVVNQSHDALSVKSKVIMLKSSLRSLDAIASYAEQYRSDERALHDFGPVFLKAIEQWKLDRTEQFSSTGPDLPIEICCVSIGDIHLAGVSAEAFSALAKTLIPENGGQVMVITGANGTSGYLPDKPAYADGGYEPNTACFFYNQLPPAPGSLEKVTAELGKMLPVSIFAE